jgi:hypothetical protein
MEGFALLCLTCFLWSVTAAAVLVHVARRLSGARPGEEDVGFWLILAFCWLLFAYRG